MGTRHEYKANKTSFTILSLIRKKLYIKLFSDRALEITLKP